MATGSIQFQNWLEQNPLSGVYIDCVVTVMLKIIDGKCKMNAEDKSHISALYLCLRGEAPADNGPPALTLLPTSVYDLIDLALECSSEDLKNTVYEHRVLAETMISRPVMKQFKAWLRSKGLYAIPLDHGKPARKVTA